MKNSGWFNNSLRSNCDTRNLITRMISFHSYLMWVPKLYPCFKTSFLYVVLRIFFATLIHIFNLQLFLVFFYSFFFFNYYYFHFFWLLPFPLLCFFTFTHIIFSSVTFQSVDAHKYSAKTG